MTEQQAATLRDRFAAELGVGTEAEFEQSGRAGRFQFGVVSPRFEGMTPLARQDLIWTWVDEVLPREETLDVAMILTFAPSELAEVDD